MAADTQAPCGAWPLKKMALTMWACQVIAFHEVEFQNPVPSQCWEGMVYILLFLERKLALQEITLVLLKPENSSKTCSKP